jgi:hypothetical protein
MSDASTAAGSSEARCAECNTLLGTGQDRETTTGGTFCRPCFNNLSAQLQQVVESQGRDVNYSLAVVGGLLGAAVGVLVWWGFTVLTGIAFGLVAIVIGFTVGHGVVRLSGGKRSAGLQGVSVAIAALAFFYASYLVNRTFIHRAMAERGEPVTLTLLPDPQLFFNVVQAGFNVMDLVFLGIVVYEAWKIPKPIRLGA